jgi:hypothetical protein
LPATETAEVPERTAFVQPHSLPLRLDTLAETQTAAETAPEIVTGTETETETETAFLTETSVEEPAETPAAEDLSTWDTKTKAVPVTTSPGPRVAALPPVLEAPSSTSVAPAIPVRQVSLEDRLAEISHAATQRLKEKFQSANAQWPPAGAGLVAVKDKKVVELHARGKDGAYTFIHRYPVLAASGSAGPKLRQGDKQVPEGVYGISFLNPNSRYHVALRVNYPNAFDREMAAKDGRKQLGGDIMIHGKAVSIGCLAVGDEASEELFVLAAEVGLPNIKLVIAPTDFRRDGLPAAVAGQPDWLPKLYTQVASAMADFKAPPPSPLSGLLSFFEK